MADVSTSAPQFFDVSVSAGRTILIGHCTSCAICVILCNNVITVTPPLAVSVTEAECVVTTQVRSLGLVHFSLQPR